MSARDLPPWIVAALAMRLEQAPRDPLRHAQQHLSDVYRSGGHSNVAIRTDEDALAYALVRMPATYAACSVVYEQLTQSVPRFAPTSILDIGAGPGTATFAAAEEWPSIAAADLFEPHPKMAALSEALCEIDTSGKFRRNAARNLRDIAGPFDLVVASYVLTEQDERAAATLVETALQLASQFVVLIEPGTKRGYQRLMAARSIAIAAGASIAAPCPGSAPCPLATDDWCHFKVRLNRRKEHRLIKAADAPFEDEPYSYLVISKRPLAHRSAVSRLLHTPEIGKAEAVATFCTPTGLEKRTIPRRNKATYKAAKHWSAGDAVQLEPPPPPPEEPSR